MDLSELVLCLFAIWYLRNGYREWRMRRESRRELDGLIKRVEERYPW